MTSFLSKRSLDISPSITLSLNEQAETLAGQGYLVSNLGSAQLPLRPPTSFLDCLQKRLKFMASFQYAPVQGDQELRLKILDNFSRKRSIPRKDLGGADVIVSNGSKHSLSNLMAATLNPDDEVILFTPYWVSYPSMVKLYRGVPRMVPWSGPMSIDPSLEELEKLIGPKTKMIMVNSPNNPSGQIYSPDWMKAFGEMMLKYPHVLLVSDEIYSDLHYFDPAPEYFYQFVPQLLSRTVVVDGVSKSLASTGLRLGWASGPKEVIQGMAKIQGQCTSGANSLVQKALVDFNFDEIGPFLLQVKNHLRQNATRLRDCFRSHGLSSAYYSTNAAFYFLLDFSKTPLGKERLKDSDSIATELCAQLLREHYISLVPAVGFGLGNCARLSLTLEKRPFQNALDRLAKFLTQKST